MTASIDLAVRKFARRRGEITAVGTWLHIDGKVIPCMALFRAGEETAEFTRPSIITNDRAWIWSEQIGDEAETTRQCLLIADALRLGNDEVSLRRIRTFIHDTLDDLLKIPPYPPAGAPRNAIAEVTVTNKATGRSHEVVLNDV